MAFYHYHCRACGRSFGKDVASPYAASRQSCPYCGARDQDRLSAAAAPPKRAPAPPLPACPPGRT